MRPLDWVVMFSWLTFIVSYGIYRGRGSTTVNKFLLAGKTMPWYAMGLSIMATQASAITFISTTGQSLRRWHALRAVLFRTPDRDADSVRDCRSHLSPRERLHGLRISGAALRRKTRALVSAIFLMQRGLAAGLSLYAPAVVLSIVLGWPDRLTAVIMGVLIVTYTAYGGIKAVTWADVPQMALIFCGLIIALVMAIHRCPPTSHSAMPFRSPAPPAGSTP